MLYSLSNGDVAVFGSELAGGDRAVKNLGMVLQAVSDKLERAHKVTSVVFSMIAPAGQLGACSPDNGAITINLMHIFCQSYDRVTETPQMESISINALFWHNLYTTYVHEILHLDNPELPEIDIINGSKAMAFEIIREYGLEPGSCEIMRAQMVELTTGAKEDDFFGRQKKMFEDGTYVWIAATTQTSELKLRSFRSYMHWASGAADDDIRWTSLPKMLAIATNVVNVPMMAGAAPVPVTPSFNAETFFNENPAGGFSPTNHDVIAKTEAFDEWLDDAIETYGEEGGDFMTGGDQYAGGGFDDDYTAPLGMVEFAQASMPASIPVPNLPPVTPVAPSTAFPAFAQATVTNMAANQHSAVRVTLPRTGLSSDQTSDIALGVYAKCFDMIFTMCGQLLNSDVPFSNPSAVSTIPIMLTDQEKQVVVAMNCFMNGRWVELPTTNGLVGYVGKFKALPTYKLYINIDGVKICRLILPQNPGKRDASGQYTKNAILARSGAKILYIMEGDDNAKANGAKQYICKAVVAPGAPLTEWLAG